MKQTEFFGFNSLSMLEQIAKKEDAKKVFLVTGRNSYTSSGAATIVGRSFPESRRVTRFSDFSPNPKLEEIQNGLNEFEKDDYQLIVAIGGGSAIDVAKAIKMFYFERFRKPVPLVAVPTTAGSGSEATHFIVYYKDKAKQSAGKPDLTLPEYSICDPSLLSSLPRKIAASSGMDALGQAIESYWCINSTDESQKMAAESIRLLLRHLRNSVNENKATDNEGVMMAANLAGKAINITKTTACHSIAYPMTSYFGVEHGHAVGLTLGQMLVYNSKVGSNDCNDKRGPEYVHERIEDIVKLLGAKTPDEAKEVITGLMHSISLPTTLSRAGITRDRMHLILDNGFTPERVLNNPRVLDRKDLEEMLDKVY